jgi:hypothetical protein
MLAIMAELPEGRFEWHWAGGKNFANSRRARPRQSPALRYNSFLLESVSGRASRLLHLPAMNIMRTLRFAARRLDALLLLPAVVLAPLAAQAQQAAAPEPPRLEKLEEGEAPAITIPGRQNEQQIEERRDHGVVTSTKVKSGPSTYYVTPNKPRGSALPGDAQSTANQPAQWQIIEFHTKRRDQMEAESRTAPGEAPAGTPGVAR